MLNNIFVVKVINFLGVVLITFLNSISVEVVLMAGAICIT